MIHSGSPFGDMLICPWCHLQASRMTGSCRRCRRPLPVTFLELSIPSNSDLDSDSSRHCIGKTLRRLRLRRGYTQSMLASSMLTHRTHVSRAERGRVTPSAEFLLRAAAALGVKRIVLCVKSK